MVLYIVLSINMDSSNSDCKAVNLHLLWIHNIPVWGSAQNCWQIPGWYFWWAGPWCCGFDPHRNRDERRSQPSPQLGPAAWSQRSDLSSDGDAHWHNRSPVPESQQSGFIHYYQIKTLHTCRQAPCCWTVVSNELLRMCSSTRTTKGKQHVLGLK